MDCAALDHELPVACRFSSAPHRNRQVMDCAALDHELPVACRFSLAPHRNRQVMGCAALDHELPVACRFSSAPHRNSQVMDCAALDLELLAETIARDAWSEMPRGLRAALWAGTFVRPLPQCPVGQPAVVVVEGL